MEGDHMHISKDVIEKINGHEWHHSFGVLPGVITPGRHLTDARKNV